MMTSKLEEPKVDLDADADYADAVYFATLDADAVYAAYDDAVISAWDAVYYADVAAAAARKAAWAAVDDRDAAYRAELKKTKEQTK